MTTRRAEQQGEIGRLLCVDIGNTRTQLGLLDGAEPLEDWRVSTEERRTPDEWAALLGAVLAEYGGLGGAGGDAPGVFEGVALSSAVPAVTATWREMLTRRRPDVPVVVVGPGVRTGIAVRMDNPREVGADRIANAVAALRHHHRAGEPLVALSFGTATTIDVLDPRGQYVGGVIAPGVEVAADALVRRTAQLRRVELSRPRSVIARNTVEALQSGLYFGLLGQIEGFLTRIAAELGVTPDELRVIATGYLAPVVISECPQIDLHDNWLTLRGLAEIFHRNI